MKDNRWFYLILLILSSSIGFCGGMQCSRNRGPEVVEIIKTDTLTVHDTIHHDRPVYVTQKVVDSIFVPVSIIDTLRLHDTTFVVLQRTQREYRDSLYTAWVSGYDPALDSINIFTRTQYITTTVQKPPKHWHIGVTGGYGATLQDKTVRLSPYIGIGLTYSIFSF